MTLLTALVWTVVAQGASVPLSGTVIDEDANPVAGVELVLVGSIDPKALRVSNGDMTPKVVARGKSDQGGRFTLDRPEGLKGDENADVSPILWAAKPGFRISATRFRGKLPTPDDAFRVILEPPGQARVRVEDPDGRPVAGALVMPTLLWKHRMYIPDEIAELAPATTGEDGVAVLEAIAQDAMSEVRVSTREYGAQVWRNRNQNNEPTTVPLRIASSWSGRLTAKDPAHVKGWKIRARTYRENIHDEYTPLTAGYAVAVSDEEGRFTLTPIAEGSLRLSLEPPGRLPLVPYVPQDLKVLRGHELSSDIPLQKLVEVSGRIQERGTGRAIADAHVFLSDVGPVRRQSRETYSDADGRYAFIVFPGKLRISCSTPKSYIHDSEMRDEEVDILEGAEPVKIKTMEFLHAAPPLRGVVRDEGGRPVADAEVQVVWRAKVEGNPTIGRSPAHSRDDGSFVIDNLPPDAEVSIMGWHRSRKLRAKQPLKIRSGHEAPVNVVISPMPLMAAAGKLTAPAGTKLGGIEVQIDFNPERDALKGIYGDGFDFFNETTRVNTEPDGSFKTPKVIERLPGEFQVEVHAENFDRVASKLIPTPDGELLQFPDLAVTPSKPARDKAPAAPKGP